MEIEEKRKHDISLFQQSRVSSMENMLTAISHHWRQPLNFLAILLENIQEEYEYNELTEELLRDMTNKGLKAISSLSNTIE
ncbi:MAG: histidine kinase, partial [Campylobacterales bacterium]|nr:histidine kinase [Campylobacterales bacterium]